MEMVTLQNLFMLFELIEARYCFTRKKKKSGTVSNIIGVSVKKFNQNTQKQKMKYPNP